MKKIFFMLLLSFCINQVSAQNHQQSGWFMLVNSTKFNNKWALHLDAQVRTNDDWQYVRNVLVRPGLTYHFNKKTNATVGYLWTNTVNRNTSNQGIKSYEQRIWEQVVYTHKIAPSSTLSHRFRLEQRFIDKGAAEDVFSQRFRYFFRGILPFNTQPNGFNEGAFLSFQNETFFNIQNKDKINGSLFDQNRAFLGLGYRVAPKLDVELGYLNQYTKGITNNTMNHVVQIGLYTRF
jgi:hypothetical protein